MPNAILKSLPTPNRMGWPWTEEVDPNVYDTDKSYPKISIVTPSFNQGQFIEETIRSIILQNYPNLEFIIIDGGSTDETIEIIKKYEPWITYWVSEKDRCQSHAINKGFAKCTGEIIAWLNSDDLYNKNILSKVASAFSEHPEMSLLHGQCMHFDTEYDKGFLKGEDFDYLEYLSTFESFPVHQPATFFKREAVLQVGDLDEALKQSMDKDLWQRLGLAGQIKFIPYHIASFRRYGEQITALNQKNKSFFLSKERIRALDNLYKLSPPKEVMKIKNKLYAFYNHFLAIEQLSNKNFKHAFSTWKSAKKKFGFHFNSRYFMLNFNLLFKGRGAEKMRKLLGLKKIYH